MNVDWRRLRAVVIESDDWGLCAWSSDERAHRALADTPAFRTSAGRRYGGSTLESAADVRSLAGLLAACRGGDGFPAILQANTVVAAPDYERLEPPLFRADPLPLVDLPRAPSRWERPGAWEETQEARRRGVWWPELHGLHHLPEAAWLRALRRGSPDARRAHEHQSPICVAVEASGEYDASEPEEIRARNLALAVAKFSALFGRGPGSFCPPDYRWDARLDPVADRLGVTTFQGLVERAGRPFPRLRRLFWSYRWPFQPGPRFRMPPRIAFEPSRFGRADARRAVEVARRAARAAWGRGQPAVVSTHRVNYAHLDPDRSAAGREALRGLLESLAADAAVFLVDAEVRQLHERGWSVRELGGGAVLLRRYGADAALPRFPVPPGAERVPVLEGAGGDRGRLSVEDGAVVARVEPGAHVVRWAAR